MKEEKKYDKIIIGAGIYGMYAAKRIIEKNHNEKVLILEIEETYFNRGSYVNQARLHNGYHYPRSYSTALKSSNYFDRFYKDFNKEINSDFIKIYAVWRATACPESINFNFSPKTWWIASLKKG